jgi:hypothetical protein
MLRSRWESPENRSLDGRLRVGPQRDPAVRVVALERLQQADDALLDQLEPLDVRGDGVPARHRGDPRQMCVDDLLVRVRVRRSRRL